MRIKRVRKKSSSETTLDTPVHHAIDLVLAYHACVTNTEKIILDKLKGEVLSKVFKTLDFNLNTLTSFENYRPKVEKYLSDEIDSDALLTINLPVEEELNKLVDTLALHKWFRKIQFIYLQLLLEQQRTYAYVLSRALH